MSLSFLECLGQGARHTYTGIPLGQGSGPNFFPFGSGDHSEDKVFQQIQEFAKEHWSSLRPTGTRNDSRELGRQLHLLPAIVHCENEYEIAVDEEIVIVDSIHDQIHTSVEGV